MQRGCVGHCKTNTEKILQDTKSQSANEVVIQISLHDANMTKGHKSDRKVAHATATWSHQAPTCQRGTAYGKKK